MNLKQSNYQGVVDPFEAKKVPSNKKPTKRWSKVSPTTPPTYEYQPVPKELVTYIKKEHSVELFEELLPRAPQKSGGKPTYICYKCGNGSGENGTGMELKMYRDGTPHLYCFKCGETFDIFSIFQYTQGSNYNFRKLIKYLINRYPDVEDYSLRLGFIGGDGCNPTPNQQSEVIFS